ncbi:MAG: protein arginine kinase [Acutalibacteraceae bacterium]
MSKKWYEQSGNMGEVIVSTRVRLARNLKDYPFPCRLDSEQKQEVADKIKNALLHSNSAIADSFKYIKMSELSEEQAVSLAERHLISPDFASDRQGRYLLLTQDETISIMLNEEDHIRIQVMSQGLDLENSYNTADKVDTLLDNALSFAFNPKLGYLTQCPTNLGTGMRASVMLHLPALQHSKAIGRIGANLSKLGLTLRGTFGEGSEPKAALYQLSNQVTLGISEQTAIENLKNIALQLAAQEKNAREELAKSMETLDIISRSRGILKSARLLSNDECLRLLSNVRLGISIGEIKDITLDTVNELMTEMQPATLMANNGGRLTPEQRDELRAKLVSQRL